MSVYNRDKWLVNLRRGRASLCFTITDYADDDQVGLVHDSTEGDAESVAELSTFVDGSRGLCVDVTVTCVSSGVGRGKGERT